MELAYTDGGTGITCGGCECTSQVAARSACAKLATLGRLAGRLWRRIQRCLRHLSPLLSCDARACCCRAGGYWRRLIVVGLPARGLARLAASGCPADHRSLADAHSGRLSAVERLAYA